MIQEGDPEALELFERYQRIAMPNLRLEDEQVDALIDYIDQESRALRRRLAATQETPTRP
jgi:protein SCO1/2